MVGVNGSGKTTTLGKLGAQWVQAGKKVRFVAGDTFRAAAVQQLQVWADRAQAPLHSGSHAADPAALAFEAVSQARQSGEDIAQICFCAH